MWWYSQPILFKCCFGKRRQTSDKTGHLRSYDRNCNENVTLKLNFALSLLLLFHVDHVEQNRRTWLHFRLLGTNGFHVKAKSERFTASSLFYCELALSTEPQIWKIHVVVWQTGSQNIAPKSVLHVQPDYFSSFNQSNHWFVALSLTLPSSNLKLHTGYATILVQHRVWTINPIAGL